jgi:hypothetical protein
VPPLAPEAWLRLFELPEPIFGPATAWSRAHAIDPAHGWDECPRGDWLVAAAARAGVEARTLIGAVTITISAIANELDRLGRPEPKELRHAIELCEAWADCAAEAPEIRDALDALGTDTLGLAWALLFATADAAHHEALRDSGDAPAGERAWARLALAQHASNALRLLAAPMGPRGGEATAAVLRSLLPWEQVERALAADASRAPDATT